MFGKIRYADGSYFPIYLFGNSKDHDEFETDCSLIPLVNKDIEVIDVSFSLLTEKLEDEESIWKKFWKKERFIFITDAFFEMNPNVSSHKCDRIHYVKPYPEHLTKINFRESEKEFVGHNNFNQ
jgi:hypothetical protein